MVIDCSGQVPGGGPPLTPFLRGTICRLAERPCPFDGPLGLSTKLPWLLMSSTPDSLCPIEIMDTERLCVCPSFETFWVAVFHGVGGGCDLAETPGVLNDNVVRCPRVVGVPRELIAELLFLWGSGFRCLSDLSPVTKPLAA